MQVVNVPSHRAANRKLQFQHRKANELFSFHAPRRLLWTEADSKGNDVRVSAIEAYFAPEARYLKGIKLIYGEVLERSAGPCEGLVSTLRLAPTEKIGAMSVDSRRGDTASLVVCSDKPEELWSHPTS